jgi:hypothetical protein
MFAPPDPSSPAVPLPEPAGALSVPPVSTPTLAMEAATSAPPMPTLPGAGSTITPTLPVATSAPGISLMRAPTAPISSYADGLADVRASEPAGPPERPATPARMFRTGWLSRIVIWASLASVPGAFVGDYVGAALVLLSVIALILWSGVIAVNIRRTRPATRHGRSPHPLMVMLSWFAAPVVGVFAAVAIAAVAAWADSGTFEEEGTRAMVLVATVFMSGLVILIAHYQPYRALGRCAKWANADSGRFRKWFVAPIVAVLLAIVVQILAGLVVLSDGSDGASSTASVGAAGVWVVSFTLPWLAWLIFGSRAMRSLESGMAHAHGRAIREALDPSEVNPLLAGQVAAAAAGVPALSAPNA